MKTLVVMNEKGGVGKTNIVAHAGWYFSERYRALVVDLDQQANLTMTLGAHLSTVDSVELFAEVTSVPSAGRLTVTRSTRDLLVIEVIWLPRHFRPDFKTIADFRRDERSAFRQVVREFVLLCRQLDLFGRELLAVDGTRIKAVNSKDRNFTHAALAKIIGDADERLSKYMGHLDKGDADEAADGGDVGRDNKLAEKIAAIRGRRERHKALLDELDRTGEDQISLTDPDARHGAHDQSRRGL